MSVYARFHNATHLVAATGILLYAVSAQAAGTGFVGLLFVLFAWGLFGRTVRSPVPRAVINVGLLLASAYMFFRVTNAPTDAIAILSEYLVVLLLIKLFENRTPRDQAQSLAICGMLAVGAVLTDPGVWTGVVLITHLLVLLVASIRFQLWSGHHLTFAPGDRISEESIAAKPSEGRRAPLRLATITTGLALLIALGGVGVFLVLPRQQTAGTVAGTNWLGESITTVSGYRDHVQLGTAGFISDSNEVVATVGLSLGGTPLTTEHRRYFRGAVLDRYDPRAGKWEKSRALAHLDAGRILSSGPLQRLGDAPQDPDRSWLDRGRRQLPELYGVANEGRFPPGLVVIDQEFELVNKTSPDLFALAHPVQVAYNGQSTIYMNPLDRTLTLSGKPRTQRYTVRSAINYTRAPTPEELERYRTIRERGADPFEEGAFARRLSTIARRVMGEEGLERQFDDPPSENDARIVKALERYLSREFAYTRRMIAPDNVTDDPTVFFLTKSRRGHCEYFASGLAGLCRSVGIEAHVVTGFVSSEINSDTGRYVIRQSNAHAWVEAPVLETFAYYPGNDESLPLERETRLVWKTYDPSPVEAFGEDGGGRNGGSDLAAALRLWLHRFEDLWVSSVVGYDADAQENLLGVTADDRNTALSEFFGRVDFDHGGPFGSLPPWAQRLVAPGLAIAGCALVVVALRRMGKTPGTRTRNGRDRETRKAVGRVDRALIRLGAPRPGHRPLLEHARRIGGDTGPALAATARALYAQRFGGAPDASAFDRALAALEQLARNRPTSA